VDKSREALLPPWAFRLLVLGLVLVLIGFQPARHLLSQASMNAENDRHAALLLAKARLDADPQRRDLRLALARLQLEAQQPGAAGETLAPLEGDTDPEVQWWLLEQRWQAINALEPGDPHDANLRRQLVDRFYDIHAWAGIDGPGETDPRLSIERLTLMAHRWLSLEHPWEAAECFEALAQRDQDRRFHWLREAGRSWMQAGSPIRASSAWHRAWLARDMRASVLGWLDLVIPPAQAADQIESPDRQVARQSLEAAFQSDSQQGMNYARQYLDVYPNDAELLDLAIRLALAVNDVDQALAWATRLQALDKDDPERLERLAAVALAAGKPELAVAPLQRLNAADPAAYAHQLANAQRWSGDTPGAVATLEALATSHPDAAADRQLVAMALAGYDRVRARAALERLNARDELTAVERGQLVDVLNDLGDPDAAIAHLRRWDRQERLSLLLKVRLATLLEQTGALADAEAQWAALRQASSFDHDEAARQQGRLLRRQWQLSDALAVLPADSPSTWQQRAELGWSAGHAKEVIESYQQLATRQPLSRQESLRLLHAAVIDGDAVLVETLAIQRWQRFKDTDAILAGFHTAQEQRRPDIARRLLTLARQDPEPFADSPAYWGLVADSELKNLNPRDALTAIRKGLRLAPADPSLRAGEIYALTMLQHRELPQRLAEAAPLASTSQQLTLAVAGGYQSIGDTRRARLWYRRSAEGPAPGAEVLMEIADTFDQSGHPGVALGLRRRAVTLLAPRLASQLEPAHRLDTAILGRQLEGLIWSAPQIGTEPAADWYQALATHLPLLDTDATTNGVRTLDLLALLGWQARYRYLWLQRHHLGLPTPSYHRLNVAIAQLDHATIGQMLDDPDLPLAPSDRLAGAMALERRGDAMQHALLSHHRGADRRGEIVGLASKVPQRAGIGHRYQEIGELGLEHTQAAFELTGERWGAELAIGRISLDEDDVSLPLSGHDLDEERLVSVSATHRGIRSSTRLSVGSRDSDAENHLEAQLSHRYNLSSHLSTRFKADWQQPSTANDRLRLLATEDRLGIGLDWTPTRRDRLSLDARHTRYHERFDESGLGSGRYFESSWEHALLQGETRRLGLRLFATHESQDPDGRLPGVLADRLAAGVDSDALFNDDASVLGLGLSLSRGAPGAPYPQVASPRWQLDLSGGHRWPGGELAGSASLMVGTRVFGSDALSLEAGFDHGTGADESTRLNASLNYQYFFGP
tara:strand:- start:3036 stop:6695 length:3660 start_codon:yes stop_codon:yes gene_type:complete